jgi:hypothetical protein
MTEAEWLASENPDLMLRHVGKWSRFRGLLARAGSASARSRQRKLRLFACACCREAWDSLGDLGQQAVEVSGRFADALATREELIAASSAAMAAAYYLPSWRAWTPVFVALDPTGFPEDDQLFGAASAASNVATAGTLSAVIAAFQGTNCEPARICDLMRDVVGNPYRPSGRNGAWLAWNGGTIPKLAAAIYKDRAFERLPVLADALEDAGCTDSAILTHCRGPGPHARGCWVVDLLLGKS